MFVHIGMGRQVMVDISRRGIEFVCTGIDQFGPNGEPLGPGSMEATLEVAAEEVVASFSPEVTAIVDRDGDLTLAPPGTWLRCLELFALLTRWEVGSGDMLSMVDWARRSGRLESSGVDLSTGRWHDWGHWYPSPPTPFVTVGQGETLAADRAE